VGTLEEDLVEKIAYEYWRLGAAASRELSLSGGWYSQKTFPILNCGTKLQLTGSSTRPLINWKGYSVRARASMFRLP
jgi:hypothetical protein